MQSNSETCVVRSDRPLDLKDSSLTPVFSIVHHNIKCWGPGVEDWLSQASCSVALFSEHHLPVDRLRPVSKRLRKIGWCGVFGAASCSFRNRRSSSLGFAASAPARKLAQSLNSRSIENSILPSSRPMTSSQLPEQKLQQKIGQLSTATVGSTSLRIHKKWMPLLRCLSEPNLGSRSQGRLASCSQASLQAQIAGDLLQLTQRHRLRLTLRLHQTHLARAISKMSKHLLCLSPRAKRLQHKLLARQSPPLERRRFRTKRADSSGLFPQLGSGSSKTLPLSCSLRQQSKLPSPIWPLLAGTLASRPRKARQRTAYSGKGHRPLVRRRLAYKQPQPLLLQAPIGACSRHCKRR